MASVFSYTRTAVLYISVYVSVVCPCVSVSLKTTNPDPRYMCMYMYVCMYVSMYVCR